MRRSELEKKKLARNASKLRIGIVVSEFNSDITEALLDGVLRTLHEWQVSSKNIVIKRVPGGFEIPFGCLQLLRGKKKPNALIALGCILKGETKHDEYIANTVAQGILRLMLDYRTPISFGILTPNTLEQAKARSSGNANKGIEAAVAALEMALN